MTYDSYSGHESHDTDFSADCSEQSSAAFYSEVYSPDQRSCRSYDPQPTSSDTATLPAMTISDSGNSSATSDSTSSVANLGNSDTQVHTTVNDSQPVDIHIDFSPVITNTNTADGGDNNGEGHGHHGWHGFHGHHDSDGGYGRDRHHDRNGHDGRDGDDGRDGRDGDDDQYDLELLQQMEEFQLQLTQMFLDAIQQMLDRFQQNSPPGQEAPPETTPGVGTRTPPEAPPSGGATPPPESPPGGGQQSPPETQPGSGSADGSHDPDDDPIVVISDPGGVLPTITVGGDEPADGEGNDDTVTIRDPIFGLPTIHIGNPFHNFWGDEEETHEDPSGPQEPEAPRNAGASSGDGGF